MEVDIIAIEAGVGAPLGVPTTAVGLSTIQNSLILKGFAGIVTGFGTMRAGFTLGRQDIVDSAVTQALISSIPSASQGGIVGDLVQDVVGDIATDSMTPEIPRMCSP